MKSENTVKAEIARFLAKHGWRRYRNHVGKIVSEDEKERVVGTPGWPDDTYRRPTETRGLVEILHVEAKAEGKRPTGEHGKRQLEKIASLNHIGEPATWANSLGMFELWYWTQGFRP